MRETLFNTLIISALALLLAACGAEISDDADDFEPSAGIVDFTTFVALGDSLTAGYADGALYPHGQVNSYPAILAQQFAKVGGGAFNQPRLPAGATGSLLLGMINLGLSDRLVLAPTGNPSSPASPVPITPSSPTAITLPPVEPAPYNNVGVPGAKSFHLTLNTYGDVAQVGATANPFFVRFASGPNTTMIADAAGQLPTFFVLWIGNNDVLSYATAGGYDAVAMTRAVDQNAANNTNPATYGSSDITDDMVFAGVYTGLLHTLTANPNTRGILVNVPDVTTIPYFTTVPFNPIPMDAVTAASVNAIYNNPTTGYNAAIQNPAFGLSAAEITQRTINFVAGQNPVVITDLDLTDLTGFGVPSIRQATANDYIVLPAAPKIGTLAIPGNPTTVWGVGAALLDADVLTESEVGNVEAARTAYNATIAGFATGNANLVLFDAAAKLTELNTTGILYGSGGISSTFAQGGAFSLDGVHPTARGYAVIANEIIKVINQGFGANIPPVDPSQYTTVFYQ